MRRATEFLTISQSRHFGHLPRQQLGYLLEDYQMRVVQFYAHVQQHGDVLDQVESSIAAEQRYLHMVLGVYHGELARRIEGGKRQILDLLTEASREFDARVRADGVVVPTTDELLAERRAGEQYPQATTDAGPRDAESH